MEEKNTASVFNRIIATFMDFLIVVMVSVFSSFVIYRIALSNDASLKAVINEEGLHIKSSHLAIEANNNYTAYNQTEYFVKSDDGEYKIIDILSYFYLVYLVNDEANIKEGEVGSPDFDKEITINKEQYIQKDYYNVKWFNENVLGLPKEGETSEIDYFEYQMNGDTYDYSLVGTVASKYIVETEVDGETIQKVDAPNKMINFIKGKYQEAINTLYKQTPMANALKKTEGTSNLITLISRLVLAITVLVVVPLCNKSGKTPGKFMFKLSLAKPDGEPIARWQVLPRSIIFLAIPVVMYFVTNGTFQMIILSGLFLVSLLLMIFNKQRMTLHDMVARTIVVEGGNSKTRKEIVDEAIIAGEEAANKDESIPFEDPKVENKEEESKEEVKDEGDN